MNYSLTAAILLLLATAILTYKYYKLKRLLTQDDLEFYLKEIDKRGFDITIKPKRHKTK